MKRIVEICCQKDGCYKTLIKGCCMYPFLNDGEEVLVYLYKNVYPKIGDIVLITINNDLYVHRIVKISKNKIITKGDNNVKIDDDSTLSNILGYVKLINDYSIYSRWLVKKISKISYNAGVYFLNNINLNREKCLNVMSGKKKKILKISKKVINNDIK